MKYRSRTDIIATILESTMHGATKTRMMYMAFLSYAQLKEYLQYLTERQLIMLDAGSREYKLTPQGLHFLEVYAEISEIVSLKGGAKSEQVPTQVRRSAPKDARPNADGSALY